MPRPPTPPLPGYRCPSCGARLDGYTTVAGDRRGPRPGDLSVCLYCAAALRVEASGYVALHTAELEALRGPENAALRLAIDYVTRTWRQS